MNNQNQSIFVDPDSIPSQSSIWIGNTTQLGSPRRNRDYNFVSFAHAADHKLLHSERAGDRANNLNATPRSTKSSPITRAFHPVRCDLAHNANGISPHFRLTTKTDLGNFWVDHVSSGTLHDQNLGWSVTVSYHFAPQQSSLQNQAKKCIEANDPPREFPFKKQLPNESPIVAEKPIGLKFLKTCNDASNIENFPTANFTSPIVDDRPEIVTAGDSFAKIDIAKFDQESGKTRAIGKDNISRPGTRPRQIIPNKHRQSLAEQLVIEAAHDIRGPLTVAMQSIGLFLEDLNSISIPAGQIPGQAVGQSFDQPLRIAQSRLQELSRWSNSILDCVRLHNQQVPVIRQPTNLASWQMDIASLLTPPVELRRGRLVFEGWDDTLPLLLVDRDLLLRILTNLIGNAARYTRPGGVVRLWAKSYGGPSPWVQIGVTDQGPGIAADQLSRWMTDNDTSQSIRNNDMHYGSGEAASVLPTGGAGIGIGLCKKLAKQLLGRLAAQSEVGVGSTFTLHLPAADTVTLLRAFAAQAANSLDARRRRKSLNLIDNSTPFSIRFSDIKTASVEIVSHGRQSHVEVLQTVGQPASSDATVFEPIGEVQVFQIVMPNAKDIAVNTSSRFALEASANDWLSPWARAVQSIQKQGDLILPDVDGGWLYFHLGKPASEREVAGMLRSALRRSGLISSDRSDTVSLDTTSAPAKTTIGLAAAIITPFTSSQEAKPADNSVLQVRLLGSWTGSEAQLSRCLPTVFGTKLKRVSSVDRLSDTSSQSSSAEFAKPKDDRDTNTQNNASSNANWLQTVQQHVNKKHEERGSSRVDSPLSKDSQSSVRDSEIAFNGAELNPSAIGVGASDVGNVGDPSVATQHSLRDAIHQIRDDFRSHQNMLIRTAFRRRQAFVPSSANVD